MANVVIDDTHLSDIAAAIREKNGLTDTYKPSEMAAAIQAITTSSGDSGESGSGTIESTIDFDDYIGRNLSGEVEFACFAAQQFDQAVVDDLDHLLTGGNTFENGFAEAVHAHFIDEFFCHFHIDVGIQQCQADLAHGISDIAFSKMRFAAQLLEYFAEFITEIIKHE